jgi:hypothetical protein
MSDAKAQIVNTQNMSKKGHSVGRQRPMSPADMRLPGEGKIQPAVGEVKEGSFRPCAKEMDSIFGNSVDNGGLDHVSGDE